MSVDYYSQKYSTDTERLDTSRMAFDDLALKALVGQRSMLVSTIQVMLKAAYDQGREDANANE